MEIPQSLWAPVEWAQRGCQGSQSTNATRSCLGVLHLPDLAWKHCGAADEGNWSQFTKWDPHQDPHWSPRTHWDFSGHFCGCEAEVAGQDGMEGGWKTTGWGAGGETCWGSRMPGEVLQSAAMEESRLMLPSPWGLPACSGKRTLADTEALCGSPSLAARSSSYRNQLY